MVFPPVGGQLESLVRMRTIDRAGPGTGVRGLGACRRTGGGSVRLPSR